MARKKNIEQQVAEWAYKTVFEDSLDPADFEATLKTCNRIAECNALVYSYLKEKGRSGLIDKARLQAIKAWAKAETTPEAYKSMFRKPKPTT